MKTKKLLLLISLITCLSFTNVYATNYKYQVKYNLDKGTNCKTNPIGFNKNNKEIVLCDATRKGYTFKGWYTDSKKTKKVTTISKKTNKTITLYAKWSKNKYYVKYDSNGGKGTMSNSTFKYDNKYKLKDNTYTKKGYTFIGWNTKSNGKGTTYKNKQEVKNLTNKNKKTITLYAMWEKNTYYVKYNGNGSTSGSMQTSTFKYNTNYSLPFNNYRKNNNVFIGWNTKKDGTGKYYGDYQSVKSMTNKNGKTITLYAMWQDNNANTYSMRVYNFKNELSTVIKCTYNKPCKLPTTEFDAPNGYKHTGWYIYDNNGFKEYDFGATVKLKVKGYINVQALKKQHLDYEPEELVDKWIKENITKDMTAIEKIKLAHDYIINTTDYYEGDFNYRAHSAYGALIEHSAVCQGYTYAMEIFLNKFGIENKKIGMNNHIWNYVKVDGKWLHLDVTWDDPISLNGDKLLWYDYFLVDDATLLKNDLGDTHKPASGKKYSDYFK